MGWITKDLNVRRSALEALWGNREPQKEEEKLSELPMLYLNNSALHWSQQWAGLAYLLQLLDGVFLLAVDFLLLEGTGFQLPEPLLQTSDTISPRRERPQQLPFLGLQRLHLLSQLQCLLLLLLQRQRGQRSGVT